MPSLKLGDIAPNFVQETTAGRVDFHEWKGSSWAVLFSHPADFTPVCTTELGEVSRLKAEWAKRNVKVIGLSCDTLESHKGWIGDIKETQGHALNFPLIADADRSVALKYNMLDETNKDAAGLPMTVRSVFVVDGSHKIRLVLTYPASTGRDFSELLRAIDSLQLTDECKVATPVNWRWGGECVVLPSIKTADAKKIFPKGIRELKPYLRMTPQPKL